MDTLDLDPVSVVVSQMEYGVQPLQHAEVRDDNFNIQECIPVGCVPPACNRTVVVESPWTETPPGQRHPRTDTPFWTETPWTETLWTETPLDRDPPHEHNHRQL